jgi:pimeloyl-ACP methyl ester carboxylesterase
MPFLDVKGVRTFYKNYGDGNKDRNVLFIHGLGSSSLVWRDIPEALSRHFHTIAIDLVGFGLSDKPTQPDNYTMEGFSKFIVDFLDTVGINKMGPDNKISLVGHSLGGFIAVLAATRLKGKLEKLVLVDSSGLLERPTPLLKDYYSAAMENNPIARFEKIKRVLEDMYASPSRLLPISVDLFDYVIERQGARNAFDLAFNNSTTTQIKPEGFESIQDIECLIIWGQKDNLIPVEYYDMFREKIPWAKCEMIPDAGHAPFVEKTALFYEQLRTFLSQKNFNE